ncbi:MAG: hypothetical protein DRP15_02730 [Candidatus Aenigmatarchaeota archaeon]|nr:MAG: hypothetical protein DRP15_02730 [Candidatus Aenigmarchaeota archaeon]
MLSEEKTEEEVEEEKETEGKKEAWRLKVDEFLLEDLEAEVEELSVNIVVKDISNENVKKLEEMGLKNIEVLALASTVSGIANRSDIMKIAELPFVEKIYKNMELKPLSKEDEKDG